MPSYTVKTPNGNVKISQKSDLQEVPTGVLVAMYNDLTGSEKKKFANRGKTVEQTWIAFQAHVTGDQVSAEVAGDGEEVAGPAPTAEEKAADKAADKAAKVAENTAKSAAAKAEREAVREAKAAEKAKAKAEKDEAKATKVAEREAAKKAKADAKKAAGDHGRIKMTDTDTIVFKTIDNPFRANSLVFERWAKVKDGMSIEKALAKADGPTRGDIRWAFHMGYIEFKSA